MYLHFKRLSLASPVRLNSGSLALHRYSAHTSRQSKVASMRFQVLTATNMRMAVFWDVAPCSLVEVDRRFRGTYCLHHQAVTTSDMLINSRWLSSGLERRVVW
jgi:hypothetical protein